MLKLCNLSKDADWDVREDCSIIIKDLQGIDAYVEHQVD